MKWPKAFIISGTDTDVGKTVVAALLTCALEGTYWKPVQAGIADGTDTRRVRSWTGLPDAHFLPEAYCLEEAASPHLAAQLEGVIIDTAQIECPKVDNAPLIIEGAGGLLVPLNEQTLLIDLLDLPVLLVARSGLGTINHTLLSIEALRARSIPILGVVMNGGVHASNRRAIEHYGQVPVLAELPLLDSLSPEGLESAYRRFFEEESLDAKHQNGAVSAMAP